MIDFILLILIGSAWCWGVFTLFYEGYLLERLGDMLRVDNSRGQMRGTWISKPLYDCPPCMASLHGIWFFFIIGPYIFDIVLPLKQLIPYMITLSGLNFIIKSIIFPEYE